jgi:hypothetical protein
MCQGLPCIGATVRLRVDVRVSSGLVPANSVGTVRAELLDSRELDVEVSSGGFAYLVRISEEDVDVVNRP